MSLLRVRVRVFSADLGDDVVVGVLAHRSELGVVYLVIHLVVGHGNFACAFLSYSAGRRRVQNAADCAFLEDRWGLGERAIIVKGVSCPSLAAKIRSIGMKLITLLID